MTQLDRYAVVGNPVTHSLSPRIHEAFAQQTGERLSYTKLPAPVDQFVNTLEDFFSTGGCGLNVTLPFKQQAYAWVGRHDTAARVAGAVNTIVRDDHGYTGCNTDGVGLVTDLTQNLDVRLSGARVLLLGAGGAAQGVVAPLLAAGVAELVLGNRTLTKAERLLRVFSKEAEQHGASLNAVALSQPGQGYDVVINATSASIAGTGAIVPQAAVADTCSYDMMYGPQTPFCEFAAASGAHTCYDGLGMLVEQAASAFCLWRGVTPATAPVLAQLRSEGLGRRA